MSNTFLEKLQEEALFQAQLTKSPLLPKKLDVFTAFFGTHSWQVLVGAAVVTALLLEIAEKR